MIFFFARLQNLKAGNVTQPYITKQKIEFFVFQQGDGFTACSGSSDLIPVPAKHDFQKFTHTQFVVNYQDVWFAAGLLLFGMFDIIVSG